MKNQKTEEERVQPTLIKKKQQIIQILKMVGVVVKTEVVAKMGAVVKAVEAPYQPNVMLFN